MPCLFLLDVGSAIRRSPTISGFTSRESELLGTAERHSGIVPKGEAQNPWTQASGKMDSGLAALRRPGMTAEVPGVCRGSGGGSAREHSLSRQCHGHTGALAEGAVDRDPAAVQLDDRFAQRQPEAGPLVTAR